jgi:hypothetical protein
MAFNDILPIEMKVFLNHIYEYKKGVRHLILYTTKIQNLDVITDRLKKQNINYTIQKVNNGNVNVYFGDKICIDAIQLLINVPLNKLTPEEDFILGAMLGYDICGQCQRYCEHKEKLA